MGSKNNMEIDAHERIALEIFTSETGAFGVVERIVKDVIEKQRDALAKNRTFIQSNSSADIGEKFKVFEQGVELVEAIFRDIGQFRKEQTKPPALNRAR